VSELDALVPQTRARFKKKAPGPKARRPEAGSIDVG